MPSEGDEVSVRGTFAAEFRSEELMEFRVLGPLEVVRQGRALEIGGGKQRTLLAALLLHANEVVSTDRLIDELWGERAPATAPKIVQGYVSRLRKVLAVETSRQDRAAGRSILLTRPPGYVLRLERGQLDADRFAALLAEARAALAAGGGRRLDASPRGAWSLARPAARRLRLRLVRPGGDHPAG